MSLYEKFLSEPDFSNKCRFLLDLFKLQLIFISITYAW